MQRRLSEFQKAARQRWPKNHKEHPIVGDGDFAVVCCSFLHPSARRMCYGEINLFETREEAEAFAEAIGNRASYPRRIAYCHASSKGLCTRRHAIERVLD